jgi:hypothetical protein
MDGRASKRINLVQTSSETSYSGADAHRFHLAAITVKLDAQEEHE